MSDTLSTLQSALSPKTGMRRIPLALESYQHPSLPASAKRLVNMYAEKLPADGLSQALLRPTPGLVPSAIVFGTGPVWAMSAEHPGTIYCASGSHFYRWESPFGGVPILTDLGEIGSPAGADYSQYLMTTIAVGTQAVVVCVPPNAFTCSHTDTAVNQIGGVFPGARSVTYQDGYFIFTNDNLTGVFFVCLLLDPTMFDALDFATAEGVPNKIRRAMVLHGEVWLFGDKAVEVWYDAGAADFPFRRQFGGVIPYGSGTPKGVVRADDSLFWITDLDIVVRSVGYKVQRVSTHAIETLIRDYDVSTLNSSFSFTQDGHVFVVFNFTARTLVYDCATQAWHERSSSPDGSATWLPFSACDIGNPCLFGSGVTGATFYAQPLAETDNGLPVVRQVILPPLWQGTHLATCNRLEVEMEVGGATPAGDVTLDWSNDGGVTWTGGPRVMNAGTLSQTRKRVFTTRLGSFRERVFRLTAMHRMTVYAVDVDITPGA
jgi:hypothetical protein